MHLADSHLAPQASASVDGLRRTVDGYDAIQKAKELNPDLIILDFSRPGMNGIEAARVLKKILPQTPIVMLTSHHPSVLRYDTQAAGIDAVVPKDGGMSMLMASLQSLLQESQ